MAAASLLIIAGVINIPVKVGARAWRRCFGLMARSCGIFGVNECLSQNQRALYIKLVRRLGLGQYGVRISPNPIFWDKTKYRFVSGRQIRLHGAGDSAKARRWPGFNAARYTTEVVLEVIATGQEIVVFNTHWAPDGKKVPRWWLIRARRASKKALNSRIAYHTAQGRDTLVMGDFNVFRPFILGVVRWLRGKGVDKIGIALSRMRLVRYRVRLIPAPTDHKHGIVVRIRLRSKA